MVDPDAEGAKEEKKSKEIGVFARCQPKMDQEEGRDPLSNNRP